MNEELKPCPFCGRKPRETIDEFGFRVTCCSGSGIFPADRDKCRQHWNSAYCWKRIEALEEATLRECELVREQYNQMKKEKEAYRKAGIIQAFAFNPNARPATFGKTYEAEDIIDAQARRLLGKK